MSEAKQELVTRHVFLDLETTGLDPYADHILELAFVVTDDAFNELGRFESVVVPPQLDLLKMRSVVYDMHTRSGLVDQIVKAGGFPDGLARAAKNVEGRAIRVLWDIVEGTDHKRLILSGNTVHFDRSFLETQMPALEACFYHRHADVSAARTVLGAKALVPADQVAHRALADCEMSLAEARALRAAFAKAAP